MRIDNNLRLDTTALLAAAERAVKAAADVAAKASLDVTPDDPGTGGKDLRGSQKVTTEQSGTKARAAISYGGRHAVPQHQRTDYRHRPGEQAKFLEQPLHASAQAALAAAAAVMRKEVGE